MEQLSFDDYISFNEISSKPSRTAYIDESGSYGFSFDKEGTQRYYIICAVVVRTKELTSVENSFDEICCNYGFSKSEMKSSTISKNHKKRLRILSEILPLDFTAILLIADKKTFYEPSPLKDYKESFVKYLHQRLYESMYAVYPKLEIVEDNYGTEAFQTGFRKYVEEHRPRRNLFDEYDFRFVDSSSSRLTQLADFIAGSIAQELEESTKNNYLQILKSKIVSTTWFPNQNRPYFANSDSPIDKYDKQIFELSSDLAQRYINDNAKSEDDDTRLKVATLRHLLFVVSNIDARRYVPAKELIRILTEYVDHKIVPNYFYRRVIATLRDDGLILASCSKGYKIPISYHDIIDYANSTANIVGPMLNRLGHCRSLILRHTDGKLDILDNQAFVCYKKYFD